MSIKTAENAAIIVIVFLICGICAVGATAWQRRYPLPVSFARTETIKLGGRVKTERFERASWLAIPSTCARLAAREGERLPTTESEIRHAKAKVRALARKGDLLARQCERDMEQRT